MSDIKNYSFMRWKSDISHFLWKSYKYFLAWGERHELEKCLNELKGTVGKKAALAMLKERGFTEEVAKQILGIKK